MARMKNANAYFFPSASKEKGKGGEKRVRKVFGRCFCLLLPRIRSSQTLGFGIELFMNSKGGRRSWNAEGRF